MVAVLDGVWLCTRKNIALKFPFDERSLKGFHCYDLDFSLNVGLNHDFIITYNVLLERFSIVLPNFRAID
ncbi:hypothetical protein SAMN05216436_106223 [bacterium A37T11]|nr:hypothetical protein SAMN05216436_106223 [bacterium A37T11]